MTIEEKCRQITCVPPWGLLNDGGPTPEQLERELAGGIGHVAMWAMFQHLPLAEHARTVNTIQRYLIEESPHGIPAIFHVEAVNGLVAPHHTVFPTGIALAATWDPDKVGRMASVVSRQARSLGYAQALTVLDVARDARWGRVHETYGEEPYLVSELGLAYVRGMQEHGPRRSAIATGKHFLGFAASEGGQHMAATAASPRELREVHARPFETAIRHGGLGSVMNSYSTIDGVPVGADPRILDDLLRGTLGFDGTVIADYGTITNLVDRQRVADDVDDAAHLALQAGLDVELPDPIAYGGRLAAAVRRGDVAESSVDRAVFHVLRDKYSSGLFDEPYVSEDPAVLERSAGAGDDLARSLARESVVLLRNRDVLPLADSVGSVAVLGPHAESTTIGFPAYTYLAALGLMGAADAGDTVNMAGLESAQHMPEAARSALSQQLGLALAHGFDAYARREYGAESLADALRRLRPDTVVTAARGCGVTDGEADEVDAAVRTAANADVVVLALGGRPGWFGAEQTEGEGSDQASIELPSAQLRLARAAAALGKPVVSVVFTGRPWALTELDALSDAVLHAPYAGPHGSAAVAEAVLGAIEPTGRLPMSVPRHSGQVPVHVGQHVGSGYRRTAADAHRGYNDMPATPLYAFGHGLGYTSFAYRDLEVLHGRVDTGGEIIVGVEVENTGTRDGVEVVQFYAGHRVRSVTRPAQQLVAFARVALRPGERARVDVTVPLAQLAYVGADGAMVVEAGTVELQVGSSSDRVHAASDIAVTGTTTTWPGARPMLPTVRTEVLGRGTADPVRTEVLGGDPENPARDDPAGPGAENGRFHA